MVRSIQCKIQIKYAMQYYTFARLLIFKNNTWIYIYIQRFYKAMGGGVKYNVDEICFLTNYS